MYNLFDFPLNIQNIENISLLKKLTETVRYIERMNEAAKSLPNQNILINTLVLREAKESSEIENIITTYDELYTSLAIPKLTQASEKEVIGYRESLFEGMRMLEDVGFLTENIINKIQSIVVGNSQGLRVRGGTVIRNDVTNEVIYTPPQTFEEITKHLYNFLIEFNKEDINIDPLIFVAFLHFQFECIHPYYDGNGRTGRILNVLYLMKMEVINSPILYLSSKINETKHEYYGHFKRMNNNEGFEKYAIYFLNLITETAKETIRIIEDFKNKIEYVHESLRNSSGKAYDPRLVDLLFIQGYTRVEYIESGLGVTRVTASKHIKECLKLGILEEVKKGNNKVYINKLIKGIFSH
ncbi:Fic family protein [Flammeovirga yaeyamensis]|uniref:Fic family protein n=1 Tax=Flammeovirga yaeyamensis TaxID=367791 RepID=A0AAX1N4W7_9BACT|nr:Fic/DOC family N-terminal domain-containing protein [Flammeovirga yaeyamensis]MBB3700458.1 Fic family protein [Flammeovirga yaeyamensis]NMF36918.1 Fic family protein [Flammeovirga yaeyamensis]QWG02535.1 Fic family protein [Flammeovirga yaeyamensis]